MGIFELKTPEATYKYDECGTGHFVIDCSCSGINGKYKGVIYKKASSFFEETAEEYQPSTKKKNKHTFYINEFFFSSQLSLEHGEKGNKSPLVLKCKNCDREFSFTYESYLNLKNRIMQENINL